MHLPWSLRGSDVRSTEPRVTLFQPPQFDSEKQWRLGLIGDPVAHSLSPALHAAAFRSLGLSASYELWPTPEAELPARLAALRETDVLGANVTVPHKLAVMGLMDELSPLAARAGAVNTIITRDGKLIGDNTDVEGFTNALTALTAAWRGGKVLVLGAGGAARAVVLGLQTLGAGDVAVANRGLARAKALAADFSTPSFAVCALELQAVDDVLGEVSVLVNATAMGWNRGEAPMPPDRIELLSPGALVVDLTYRDTDLLRAARQRGLLTLDGLPMLVHQAAGSITRWTGLAAPLAAMLAAGEDARLARR